MIDSGVDVMRSGREMMNSAKNLCCACASGLSNFKGRFSNQKVRTSGRMMDYALIILPIDAIALSLACPCCFSFSPP